MAMPISTLRFTFPEGKWRNSGHCFVVLLGKRRKRRMIFRVRSRVNRRERRRRNSRDGLLLLSAPPLETISLGQQTNPFTQFTRQTAASKVPDIRGKTFHRETLCIRVAFRWDCEVREYFDRSNILSLFLSPNLSSPLGKLVNGNLQLLVSFFRFLVYYDWYARNLSDLLILLDKIRSSNSSNRSTFDSSLSKNIRIKENRSIFLTHNFF